MRCAHKAGYLHLKRGAPAHAEVAAEPVVVLVVVGHVLRRSALRD
jgi:hypothetical protein